MSNTEASLRSLFTSRFDHREWTDFLHRVFGADTLYTNPQQVGTHHNDTGFFLGEFTTTDNYKVGLFRFDITSGSILHRKVGLRDLANRYLRNYGFDSAIVVFHDPDDAPWRFSYICDIKGADTAPRRFTYVFGDSEHLYRTPIERFQTLKQKGISHQNLLEAFAVEALTEKFYNELADWYLWAVETIKLPIVAGHFNNAPNGVRQNNAQFVVRLLCRKLFCWFLKERRLIDASLLDLKTDKLFFEATGSYSPTGNHYYRGILQNIFFNCLNTPMGDARRVSTARTAHDKTVADPELRKFNYRGKNYLPTDFDYTLFDTIPYLNGGLFDCLDEDNASDTIDDATISIPNYLFFGSDKNVGLNQILAAYKFTIMENTPFDQEIALDPELLGLVFENLLAEIDSSDPNIQKSARKVSGAYYTPRPVVTHMVNEALHLHLLNVLGTDGLPEAAKESLHRLIFADEWPTSKSSVALAVRIVHALDHIRILDPACGSGAFPMGVLHRIVDILALIDPQNALWKQRQLDIAAQIPSDPIRTATIEEIKRTFARDNDDYGRKLCLIKNALYGIDIQPLAVLITKLRFFISLLAEQKPDLEDQDGNYGLIPFPNLETKILCANTLRESSYDIFAGAAVKQYKKDREAYYRPDISRDVREELADDIAEQLAKILPDFALEVTGTSFPDRTLQAQRNIALIREWFRHSTLPAPFFLFNVFFPEVCSESDADDGFDIVIGNPPYGGAKISDNLKDSLALGSKDIYGAFIARFLADGKKKTPLRAGGVLAYIVSDTFMTIKTHLPLRKQLMGSRLHKVIRVADDTFKATVSTAIIVLQKGTGPGYEASNGEIVGPTQTLEEAWQHGPFCQMVDLTNISIHEQYERFLALLASTAGNNVKPRQISTEECASYTYPQSLIATNSNLPFFVASPKLFALMNDTTAPTTQRKLADKTVTVRTITLNDKQVEVTKLSEIAEVKVGLQTGDNKAYLFQNPEARGNYRDINAYKQFLLTEADLNRICTDNDLRLAVIENGISKDDKASPRYFGGRYIIPHDKGGESDIGSGWLPNYHVATNYFIDWSEWAVKRMLSLVDNRGKLKSRFQNVSFYFVDGIDYSQTGVYCPTFRLNSSAVFNTEATSIFSQQDTHTLLAKLGSKVTKFLVKNFIDNTVHASADKMKEVSIVWADNKKLRKLVKTIVGKQQDFPRYDYASHEQLAIDQLIYEAYGLNEADMEEVERWHARRYPKLVAAQRENLKRIGKLPSFTEWNIYCDESRHLAHDHQSTMFLGALRVPRERVRSLTEKLRKKLRELGFPHVKKSLIELKWTKVSPAGLKFYEAILDFFATEADLRFFVLAADKIAPPIPKLPKPPSVSDDSDYDTPEWTAYNAELEATAPTAVEYLHAHEAWYYDRYFDLLRCAITPTLGKHIIYLDVKDTRGGPRIRALEKRLSDAHYDWLRTGDRQVVEAVRQINSRDVLLDQLADVLLGAYSWVHSPPTGGASSAKFALAKALQMLLKSSPQKIGIIQEEVQR